MVNTCMLCLVLSSEDAKWRQMSHPQNGPTDHRYRYQLMVTVQHGKDEDGRSEQMKTRHLQRANKASGGHLTLGDTGRKENVLDTLSFIVMRF